MHDRFVRKGSWGHEALGATLPETREAATRLGTAKGNGCVRPTEGPVHSGALETRADGHLAPGLHDGGGSTQPPCPEVRVAHAASIHPDITDALSSLIAPGGFGARAVMGPAKAAIIAPALPCSFAL